MTLADTIQIGDIIDHEGGEWEIIGIGNVFDDRIVLHLAHTSEGRHQRNGWVPRQMIDKVLISEAINCK